MLNFGSLNSFPTPASDFFWEFVGGAAPDNIELKAGNGVTGIDAPYPADTRLRLSLNNSIGIPISGATFLNGTKFFFNGISVGGNQRTGTRMNDTVTGESSRRDTNQNFLQTDSQTDGLEIFLRTADKTGITETIGDLVTGDNVFNQHIKTAQKYEVQTAGLAVLVYGGDANGWIVTDGTNQRFRIKPNGNIQTDQAAPAALKVPNGNYIEIFDMAGASLGFIQLTA